MAATIAEKLYVTIQYRKDAGNDDGHLGFASPYTKDAAFQKRKATQDSWAYGYGCTIEIDDEDNVTFSAGETSKVDTASAFIGGWYPKVIKNEPVEGFEIAKSIRRYGWSGSGNVVWRITDPRGFDLEISSDNFASIVAVCDMEKGLIKGKCVWGREGSKNVLLPEVSEPFQEALTRTKKVNAKVSLKDIQIGDTVDLLTTKASDEDSVAVYYGKMYFLSSDRGVTEETGSGYYRSYPTFNGVYHFDKAVKESYLFKSVKTGKFITLGSPKVSYIVNKLDKPLDKHAMALRATSELTGRTVGDIYNVVLISDTKIDLSKVEIGLMPTATPSEEEWPLIDDYYAQVYVTEYNGATYLSAAPGKYDRLHRNEKLTFNEVLYKPEEKRIELQRTGVTTNQGYYGSRTNYTNKKLETFKLEDMKLNYIVVKHNDIEGTVRFLG